MGKVKIAVGADGRGSTLEAIIKACKSSEINGEVVLVFGNNKNAFAFNIAREHGVAAYLISRNDEDWESELLDELKAWQVDLICLAGFLKLLSKNIVQTFPHAILNSHPAVDLVRFGGKGMYGTHVTEAVIAAGEKETGSTIHFVNENYDEGDIIMQSRVEVKPGDTPESLMERQLPIERRMYIEVIRQWINFGGNISLGQKF